MRLPIVTLGMAFFTSTLYLLAGAMPETLIWHQDTHLGSWQWVSTHFAHISVEHLIWNLLGLIVLGSIIEQTSRKVLGLALFAGIIGVNMYLASLFSLNAYAGLSGALNALLLIALYFLYQRPDYKKASVTTLILSIGKIIVEYSFEFSLFSKLPWPSVPQAHLAGLVAGAGLALFLEIRKRKLLNSDLVSFNELSPERRPKNEHRCSKL